MRRWTWTGSDWSLLSSGGVGPRGWTGFAFDAAHSQAVLYGGYHYFDYDADTQLWNGTGWSSPTSGTPSKRFSHTMVYDAARSRVVMFGGRTEANTQSSALDETWEWTGAFWTKVTPTQSPPARSYQSMAYDPIRQRTVVTCGIGATGPYLTDTWEYDGKTWLKTSNAGPSGPAGGFGNTMVWDGVNRRMLMINGYNQGSCNTTEFEYHTLATTCASDNDCAVGTYCVDAVCCASADCGVCGACNLPASPGTCDVVKNAQDPGTCDGTKSCDGAGLCQ